MKAGWEVKTLGEVCRLLNGRAYKKPELLSHGKYPVLRVGNFFTNNNWYFSDLELPEDKYCDNGDLLYAWSASFGPRVWEGGKVIYHYHIWKVEPKAQQIDKRYLYYFFDWDKERIKNEQGAGTTMIHVSKTSMDARKIPLPPLEEQKRIVSILDEAFEGLDRARENAEANLKSARELFDNQLENELSVLPKSSQCLLDEHVDLLSGFAFKSKAYSEEASDMRLMRGDNIIPGKVRWEQAKYWPNSDIAEYERYMLKADDLLIAMDRTWIKSGIKYAVLKSEDVPCLLVQRVARLRSKSTISHAFLELLISSQAFEQYVIRIQTGLGVPHISSQQIKDFPANVPSSQKQHEIAAKMQSFRTSSESLEADYRTKLQDISDLRQSLLQKAFAGELT